MPEHIPVLHIVIESPSSFDTWDQCLVCGSSDLDGPCEGDTEEPWPPEDELPDYPTPDDEDEDSGFGVPGEPAYAETQGRLF